MTWETTQQLLLGVNRHSSYLGRQSLLVVYAFRVLVYFMAAGRVSVGFKCNTQQPGCTNVCYNYFFPISHIHLWALQLIFVTCPSLLVVGHVKWREQRNLWNTSSHKGAPLYGTPGNKCGGLWWTYLLSLVLRFAFDTGFLFVLYVTYDGYVMPELVECWLAPCPHRVECYISNPTEQTGFTLIMVASACVYMIICVCEIIYLCVQCKRNRQQETLPESHALGVRGPNGAGTSFEVGMQK